MELLDVRAHDGSRRFIALPKSVPWRRLRHHLKARTGVELTGFVTDGVTEGWLDFTYGGHRFTANDQLRQYWFFVDDPAAPDELLRDLADYCAQLLGEPSS